MPARRGLRSRQCPGLDAPGVHGPAPGAPQNPFTEDHEVLRRAIRAFVEKRGGAAGPAWEEAGQIPRAFWLRLGELGLLGLEFPVEYGGGGGDFLSSVVLGEEMARCRSGGVAFSVLVHTDMSSPWLTRYGTEAQKRRYLPGISAARRCARSQSPSRARAPTWPPSPRGPSAPRDRLSPDRQQDLHHQRRLRRPVFRRRAHRGRHRRSGATTVCRCSWWSGGGPASR